MSAFPDKPDHFLQWLQQNPDAWARVGLTGIGGGSFVPRALYGDYIHSLLVDAERRGEGLRRICEEAVDIVPLMDGTHRIALSGGSDIRAAKVVLAIGNFPPGDPRLSDTSFHRGERYLRNPWSIATIEKLGAPGDVVVLGSGLTSLDLLQTLRQVKHEGRIHVISRRGLFPQPHRSVPEWRSSWIAQESPKSILELFRMVRREVRCAAKAGHDWRGVIDSMRPHIQRLWQALAPPEKRRFLRHLRPYWESHRHRTSAAVLGIKTELERSGRLLCHRGRLSEIREEADYLTVRLQRTGNAQPVTLRTMHVVNCTGPECNYQHLDHPLVLQLFARGLIRPDPLYLGLDASGNGALRNFAGIESTSVFTLGSPLRGILFETTAVPELRAQAQDLARRLSRDLHGVVPEEASVESSPDPAYMFEI